MEPHHLQLTAATAHNDPQNTPEIEDTSCMNPRFFHFAKYLYDSTAFYLYCVRISGANLTVASKRFTLGILLGKVEGFGQMKRWLGKVGS